MRLFLAMIGLVMFVGCDSAYELRHCVDNCNVYLRRGTLDKQTVLKCYETCKAIAQISVRAE